MASLMPFLRASLGQTMIRKLATVGKVKDGLNKADEHLTILMDQEHMITIEDTDTAIKRCEQYLQRAATDEGSPKAKVLATEVEISGQDTAAELAALNLRRPPRLKTPRSRRSRLSCAAIHRAPSGRAKAPQWTRNLFQYALFAANGGTTLRIVGTSWTPAKPSYMWPRRTVTRRRRTWPSASRLTCAPLSSTVPGV